MEEQEKKMHKIKSSGFGILLSPTQMWYKQQMWFLHAITPGMANFQMQGCSSDQ